jgi:flavin-dependent dehydrogenase
MDLTYKNSSVNGVTVRLKSGQKVNIKANIVIDGSGAHSILRKRIKSDFIQNEIPKDDLVLCYREIIQFNDDWRPELPTDSLNVILDSDKVPGGYIWYFTKSNIIANLGLGVSLHQKSNLKPIYHNFVINKFLNLKNYTVLSSSGDIVPIRRSLPSCADNGIMFIGDAGCHVNTASGAGIHTGMKAGYYAALIAKKAIDAEDYSLQTLWDYNCLLMNDFGAGHATTDVARFFIQHIKTNDFNYIIRKKLLDDEELTQMFYSKVISPSIKNLIPRLLKTIQKPKLLFKLNYLLKQMKRINRHYLEYPQDASGYKTWREKENDLFNNLCLKLTAKN